MGLLNRLFRIEKTDKTRNLSAQRENSKDPTSHNEAGIHSALVREQKELCNAIFNFNKEAELDGFATANWILTPNFDITDFIVENIRMPIMTQAQAVKEKLLIKYLEENKLSKKDLVEQYKKLGIDEEILCVSESLALEKMQLFILRKYIEGQLFFVSLDHIDAHLADLGIERNIINKMSISQMIEKLQDLLVDEAKKGKIKFIIGDVHLLDKEWNMNLKGAVNGLKERYKEVYDKVPKQDKVNATLWLVNFEKMEKTQREKAIRRHTELFNEENYDRTIVQITSSESASYVIRFREAAKAQGGYSIQMILKNL